MKVVIEIEADSIKTRLEDGGGVVAQKEMVRNKRGWAGTESAVVFESGVDDDELVDAIDYMDGCFDVAERLKDRRS